MKKFNKRELELIEQIRSAESYVEDDNEFEIDRFNDGWYACEDDGNEIRLIEDYSIDPLITYEEIEDNDVNVYAVFDYCHIAYCG